MAKSQKNNLSEDYDKTLDDIDNFLDDMPDFNDGMPGGSKNKDKPYRDLITDVKEGMKGEISKGGFWYNAIKRMLPESYKAPIHTFEEVADNVKNLYDKTLDDLKQPTKQLVKSLDGIVPQEEGRLRSMTNKLKDMIGIGDEGNSLSEEQQQELNIQKTLSEVFQSQANVQTGIAKAEASERRERDKLESKRFEISAGLLASVNQNIAKLVSFNEQVNFNVQKKSLEVQLRSYYLQARTAVQQQTFYKAILDVGKAIVRNTGLSEDEKIRAGARFERKLKDNLYNRMQDGIFNSKPWQNFTKALGVKVEGLKSALKAGLFMGDSLLGGASMVADMGSSFGMTPSMMLAQQLGALIADKSSSLVGKVVSNKLDKDKNNPITAWGNQLAKMHENPDVFFEDMFKSLKKTKLGGKAFGMLGNNEDALINEFINMFRGGVDKTVKVHGGIKEMIEPGTITNRTIRSIEEIIPGYLSRILQQVTITNTGNPETPLLQFDANKSSFVSVKQAKANLHASMKEAAKSSSDRTLDTITDMLVGNEKISDTQRKQIKSFAQSIVTNERGIFDKKKIEESEDFKKLDPKMQALWNKLLVGDAKTENELIARERQLQGLAVDYRKNSSKIFQVIKEYIDGGQANVLVDAGYLKDLGNGQYETVDDKIRDFVKAHQMGDLGKLDKQVAIDANKDNRITSTLGRFGKPFNISGKGTPTVGGQPNDKLLEELKELFKDKNSKEYQDKSLSQLESINRSIGKLDLSGKDDKSEGITKSIDAQTEKVSGLLDTINKSILSLKESTDKNLDALVKSVPDLSNLGDKIAEAMSSAKAKLGEGVGKAKDLIGQGTEKAKEMVPNDLPHLLFELGKKGVSGVFGLLSGTFNAGVGLVKGTYNNVIAPAAGLLKKGFESSKGPIVDGFKFLMGKALAFGGTLFNFAKDTITTIPTVLGKAKKAIMKVKDFVVDMVHPVKDVYIKGEDKPILRAILMKSGYYFDKESGDPIKHGSDIKGPVVDKDGNIIVSEEDIQRGLVDVDGNEFKSLASSIWSKAKAGFKFAKKWATKAVEFTAEVIGTAWKGGKAVAGAGFDLTKNILSKLMGGVSGIKGDTKKLYDALVDIRYMLQARFGMPIRKLNHKSKDGGFSDAKDYAKGIYARFFSKDATNEDLVRKVGGSSSVNKDINRAKNMQKSDDKKQEKKSEEAKKKEEDKEKKEQESKQDGQNTDKSSGGGYGSSEEPSADDLDTASMDDDEGPDVGDKDTATRKSKGNGFLRKMKVLGKRKWRNLARSGIGKKIGGVFGKIGKLGGGKVGKVAGLLGKGIAKGAGFLGKGISALASGAGGLLGGLGGIAGGLLGMKAGVDKGNQRSGQEGEQVETSEADAKSKDSNKNNRNRSKVNEVSNDPRYKSEVNAIDQIVNMTKGFFENLSGGFSGFLDSATSFLGSGFKGIGKGIKGLFGKAKGLLGGKGVKGLIGGVGKLAGKAGGLLKFGKLAKIGVGSLVATGVGALASKFIGGKAGGAISGAADVAGIAADVGMKAGAATGVAGAGGGLLSGLGAAAGALMLNPITWGVLGAGALAVGGYFLYKYITRDNVNEWERIRMSQYGLSQNDELSTKQIHKVLSFEKYLLDGKLSVSGNVVDINRSKLDQEEILKIFDVDKEDVETQNKLNEWIKDRFLPFFLKHVNAMQELAGNPKIDEVDKLKPEQQSTYLTKVQYDSGPYNELTSPFKEVPMLSDTSNEVKEQIAKINDKLKDKLTKGGNKSSKDDKAALDKRREEGKAAQDKAEADNDKAKQKEKEELQKENKERTKEKALKKLENQVGQPDDEGKPQGDKATVQQGSGGDGGAAGGAGNNIGANIPAIPLTGGDFKDGTNADAYLVGGSKLNGANPQLIKQFRGMVQEFGEKSGGKSKVHVNSGFRSMADQARVAKQNPGNAAKPGSSPHEYGFAIDINTGEADAMEKMGLMRKYGFTRPIGAETWHIEPAGIQQNIDVAKKDPNYVAKATAASVNHGGGGLGTITRNNKPWNRAKFGPRRRADVAKKFWGAGEAAPDAATAGTTPELTNALGESGTPATTASSGPTAAANASVGVGAGATVAKDIASKDTKAKDAPKDDSLKGLKPGTEELGAAFEGSGEFGAPDDEPKPAGSGSTGGSTAGAATTGSSTAPVASKTLGGGKDEMVKLVQETAKKVGVDEKIVLPMVAQESGFNPKAGAKTSSAKGLYQFIGSTWNAMKSKYASKFGIAPDASPFDAQANALLGAQFTKDNIAGLKAVKSDLTSVDAYAAHFLGPGGAKKLLKAVQANPSTPASAVFSASVINANKPIFTENGRIRSVGEVYKKLQSVLESRAKEYGLNVSISSSIGSGGQQGATATAESAPTQPASSDAAAAAGAPAPTVGGGDAGAGASASASGGGNSLASSLSEGGPSVTGGASATGSTPEQSIGDVSGILTQQLEVAKETVQILREIKESLGRGMAGGLKGVAGDAVSKVKEAANGLIPNGAGGKGDNKLAKPPVNLSRLGL